MKKTPFKSILKKYAPTFAGAAIIIGGIASAALTELPGSLPASVSTGDTIEASHISDIFTSLRTLDDRTDGDTPVDGVDLANKDYVDNEITTATSSLASTSYVDTQVSTAGDDLGNHTASQTINANNQKITNLSTPTANTDATTKEYVDGVVGASGGGSYSGGQYVQFTKKKYNGNLGGIAGAHAKCAEEYPGYRMANETDPLGEASSIITTMYSSWIQSFDNNGMAYNDNIRDCNNWTLDQNNNTGYGVSWNPSNKYWQYGYSTTTCNTHRPIACVPDTN